ncbi:hypothetical protein QVD17_34125 [Tagetes erecta]|uniref:IBH1-like N-terminal domain-containing protein n=1 Tax=Tagetes erecta TaxID=13708 RepID=A0AAD8NLM7_TARER|nr:hypothetical protein QVD17_34125 [Tagetes erecta]
MSPQPSSTNPNSLKIQLAYQFLHNLNNLNSKRSNLATTHIRQRSNRVKIAAYASMAYVVGSRRAWSRAILRTIRNRRMLARNKRVDHKITHRPRSAKRRNPKRDYVDPNGNSGQEVKLRKLVPGVEKMDACGLLDETADYIKYLKTQVEVMKNLVDLYSTI